MAIRLLQNFIRHEAFAGLLLMFTAALALILDNSAYANTYESVLRDFKLTYWVNHGLMSFFFVTVGLEIKRELMVGELNSVKKASLPLIAAVGGMVIPAALFLSINAGQPHLWRGWAIPMATDIAFSLGVMQLLGKRCPLALKVFLLALATFDDLGAVIVIAVFYSSGLNSLMLSGSLAVVILLSLLNYWRIANLWLYLSLGALLWYFTAHSGVDAAISGVVFALCIPLKVGHSTPAIQLEKSLHPFVAYGIVPLFALVNAGVPFQQMHDSDVFSSLTLGIALSLLLGKPLGVLLFSKMGVALRLASLPSGVNWRQLTGVGFLCGIGFTMSLFIRELAFSSDIHHYEAITNQCRLGILSGSVLAGAIGYAWLRRGNTS